MVREMIGVIQLKKYRSLNEKYTSPELRAALQSIKRKEAELLHNPPRINELPLPQTERCIP
jgi:hypothetical protein